MSGVVGVACKCRWCSWCGGGVRGSFGGVRVLWVCSGWCVACGVGCKVCVGVMRVFGCWGCHGALMVLMLVSRSGWAAV